MKFGGELAQHGEGTYKFEAPTYKFEAPDVRRAPLKQAVQIRPNHERFQVVSEL